MTTTSPRSKRRLPLLAAGIALATCATLGAGASAFAYDDTNPGLKDTPFDTQMTFSKVDGSTGAPLGGAVFELKVRGASVVYVGVGAGSNGGVRGYTYDKVDPATWGFDSLRTDLNALDPDVQKWVGEVVANTNALTADMMAQRHNFLAAYDGFDPAAAQADIDAWAAYDAAHNVTALQADANAKQAERQRLADEVLALQKAGQPVPAETYAAFVTARDAAQAAAQAVQDALGTDGLALSNRAAKSAQTLAAYTAAVKKADFLYGPERGDITASDVDQSKYWAQATPFFANQKSQSDRALKQAQCNADAGLSNLPVRMEGDTAVYEIASCPDGSIATPVGTGTVGATLQEIKAPEGYVLDSTVYTVGAPSPNEVTFNGLTIPAYDGTGTLDFSKAPIKNTPATPPPPAPPVTPPPTTPPAPPVTPPTTPPAPEKLAYTGGDAAPAGWAAGIAALALAAGGSLLAIRKRRA